jgi:GT2 family glycosyltransferase
MDNPEPDRQVLQLSVVIISYNTIDFTADCLRSIYREAIDKSFEVIVLDNASTDGSATTIAELFPQVRLIKSNQNHGFANGNNIATAEARGEWILLLNPDTVVKNHAIDILLQFARKHPEASIFGGRTLFADGTLNPASCWARPTFWSIICNAVGLAGLFPGSKLFDPESMGDWRRDTVREVDIVTGCFFLLRKQDWQALGGFNEDYFMYAEEADLCLRAAQRGRKCLICPDAQIIHYGGASEKIHSDKMVRLFRAKSKLFRMHWSPIAATFGILTLDLWALVRLLGYSLSRLVTNSNEEQLETWRRVWKNRKEWHPEAN